MTHEHRAELWNLFHLARTVLAYAPDQSRWARKDWAMREFRKEHPEFSFKTIWLEFDQ